MRRTQLSEMPHASFSSSATSEFTGWTEGSPGTVLLDQIVQVTRSAAATGFRQLAGLFQFGYDGHVGGMPIQVDDARPPQGKL
jgi:hypothetical protein